MATGTLSPEPYLTVVNASGVPYVGAKVFTYIAGTTTPAATYTDVGLTVANANPIITDSAGRYTVFLPPGASFKYVIQDSTGAAIKTIDNVSAVPASSANLDITGTAGESLTAGQVVYLSDGSGGKTAGQWYKADSANTYSSSAAIAVGMVPASISAAASGTIRLAGQMTGLSSLTLGTTYYAGTAGALTSTQPTNARIIGVADSTSSLVLAANPGIPNADNGVGDFRLSLTSGTPVTTADVTAATTLYCTPYRGNRIGLADALGNVTIRTSAEFSIAIPATTATMYDVFAFSNAGVPTLELLAWSNSGNGTSARATAVVLTTTGFYTKSGDLTRRLIGSVYTGTVSGQTEVSATKMYVSNVYNRVRRPMIRQEGTASWPYTLATIRQANGAAANQLDFIVSINDSAIDAQTMINVGSSSGAGIVVTTGIGLDSTSTFLGEPASIQILNANTPQLIQGRYKAFPGVGKHFCSWNEYSAATGLTTWYASGAGANAVAGISLWVEG